MEKLEKRKERIFWISTGCVCLLSLSFLRDTLQVLNSRQNSFHDYPKVSDLAQALLYLLVLIVARETLTRWPFRSIADLCIARSAPDREERLSRFAVVTFKLIYFLLATIYGFWLLRDEPWFPVSLGGKIGDPNGLWTGHPFVKIEPGLRIYYDISLAYHLHSLVYHALILPRRNDYAEMLTHHFLAIFLIVYSYLLGYHRIGALVLLVHDLPDIPGYAVKASVLTPYTYLTLSIHASLLVIWGYARLYVFPVDIILATIGKESVEHLGTEDFGRYPFFGMLVGLLLMHVYWYCLFIYMGWKAVTSGRPEDIQQKLGSQMKGKNKGKNMGKQGVDEHGVSNGERNGNGNGNGNGDTNGNGNGNGNRNGGERLSKQQQEQQEQQKQESQENGEQSGKEIRERKQGKEKKEKKEKKEEKQQEESSRNVKSEEKQQESRSSVKAGEKKSSRTKKEN